MDETTLHPLEKKVKAQCVNMGLEEAFSVPGARGLAAVSGGVDSMVMLTLMLRFGYPVDVATCNFGLRPEAADEVELVRAYSERMGVAFFTKTFDLQDKSLGGSVQERAREARYRWLREVQQGRVQPEGPILTAHHQDDEVETILLNLLRFKRTSLVEGIPPLHHNLYRPLLICSKAELLDYAKEKEIPFMEDGSNAANTYLRNKVRNQLIPVLREINPNITDHVIEWKERNAAFDKLDESLRQQMEADLVRSREGPIFPASLQQTQPLLWERMVHLWLHHRSYEFRKSACALMRSQPGHHLLEGGQRLDRVHGGLLLQAESSTSEAEEQVWDGGDEAVTLTKARHHFDLQVMPWDASLSMEGVGVHYLDFDKVALPIRLRNWEHGDRMRPLGLHGNKKISDILVDLHIPVTQKADWMVFEDQKQIICLPGFRISENVKVDETTTRVLKVTLRRS
jgi:tRNA(Ile)-lysidine synthase